MADRVMLAANEKWNERKVQAHLDEAGFLYMQPKIDGMRVFVSPELAPQSRSGKIFKQRHLHRWLGDHPSLAFSDGEVVGGHQYDPTSFRQAMSNIRAEDGTPDFTYYMYDTQHPDTVGYDYDTRRARIANILRHLGDAQNPEGREYHARLILTPQIKVHTLEQIYTNEVKLIAEGWEGGILRRNDRPYKCGRATFSQGSLLKLKRFEDAEAIVVGYEPWEVNDNEPTQSPLGYTVRSSHQENLRPIDRLGVLKVELLTDRSIKFGIGVMRGVTHEDRDRLWANRDSLIGKIAKFEHQGYGGGYDKPRTPVFIGWRNEFDL